MEERQREGLIKELESLREKIGESVGHLKKLRKEIKLSIKRLQRKRKLPDSVDDQVDKVNGMILTSFFQAYLSLLDRTIEHIKDGLEELGLEIRKE